MKDIENTTKPVEMVLVAPKEVFPFIMFTNGFFKNYGPNVAWTVETALEQLWLKDALFMARPKAEEDENFKQFIPYCVLQQNGKFFCYKRTKKGGEKRLHDMRSIGVGGHIGLIDNVDNNHSNTIINGLKRELHEEVGLSENQYTYKLLGSLYDDSTPVNRVHLGLVYLININDNIQLQITDKALANGGFEELQTLEKYVSEFELWSQITLNNKVLK